MLLPKRGPNTDEHVSLSICGYCPKFPVGTCRVKITGIVPRMCVLSSNVWFGPQISDKFPSASSEVYAVQMQLTEGIMGLGNRPHLKTFFLCLSLSNIA